jgi:MFS family permease
VTSGLHTVAIPVLVARILNGSGRINTGQGAIVTAQSAGAALSPALGGWIAQWSGYTTAFYVLGACAVLSIVIWMTLAPAFKPMRTIAATKKTRARKRARRPATAPST